MAGTLLSACGGSGTDISGGSSSSSTSTDTTTDTTTDTSTTYSYSLSVDVCSTADVTACDSLSEASLQNTNYVVARVVDTNKQPVSGKVVTLTTDLGTIKPSSGKITNSSGYAVFTLVSDDAITDAGELSNITVASADAESVTKSIAFGANANLEFTLTSDIGSNSLPQGSTAVLNVAATLNGEAYKTPITLSLTSSCASAGTAVMSSSITTDTNGLASTTYKGVSSDASLACGVDDVVTAALSSTQSKTVTIKNKLAATSTIIASTPSPEFMTLKGYNSAKSQIVFTVKNSQGTVVPNTLVSMAFSLANANLYGYSLSPTIATTDSSGNVTVTVNAGTVPVPVAVKASINGTDIQTVSQPIAVGTGYPDSDSFSFSADNYSLEGRNNDGATSTITIRLADRFNNPIPDGTKVYFTTEGGSIKGDYTDATTGSTPNCITSDSTCTATLTTMNPRPTDGRVTVLAYTEGEESFKDINGNGVLDEADYLASTDMPYFDDISEPFLDENLDSIYTSGEFFSDLNGDALWTAADSVYKGLACADAVISAGKCENSTVQLYSNAEFIFSSITDGAMIYLERWNGSAWVAVSGSLDATAIGYYRFLPVNIAASGVYNPLPSGTQISVTTTNGGDILTAAPSGYTADTTNQESARYIAHAADINTSVSPDITAKIVSSAVRPYYYYFALKPETTANGKTSGTLTIKATTSSGSSTGTGGSVAITADVTDNG